MRDYDDFLMVRYSVLALFIRRTNDRRGFRQTYLVFLRHGISRSEPSARGRYRRTTLNPSVGEELKMALNRHRQLIERPLCAISGPLRKSPTQQKVIVPTALGRHLSNANRKKVTSGR